MKDILKVEHDPILHNYNLIISYLRNMKKSYCIILEGIKDQNESDKIQYLINELDQQINKALFEMTEFISVNYLNGDK